MDPTGSWWLPHRPFEPRPDRIRAYLPNLRSENKATSGWEYWILVSRNRYPSPLTEPTQQSPWPSEFDLE